MAGIGSTAKQTTEANSALRGPIRTEPTSASAATWRRFIDVELAVLLYDGQIGQLSADARSLHGLSQYLGS
jgi:hypothetical protein